MVDVAAARVNVLVVAPLISAHGPFINVDDCHWIVPTLPVNVKAEGVFPEQIDWLELAVPPTEVGFTVIVIIFEITDGQTPLVTTAW